MAPPCTRKRMTYATKLEIIKAIDRGEKKAYLARKYDVNESTIRTIYKDKEKIKKVIKSTQAQGSIVRSFSVKNLTLKTTEQVLVRFLEKQNRRGIPIHGPMIRRKARALYKEVAKIKNVTNPIAFNASRGWCTNFMKRHKLRRVTVSREIASADLTAAQEFPYYLRKVIEEGGYTPDQIFNGDETGLVWKKMPKKTYLARHQKAARGFKAYKDRVTFLLTTNASGSFKMKPLVIHRAKRPRPYSNMDMTKLNVHWLSNRKAWMSSSLCLEWFDRFFVPDVQRFCNIKKIPFKILLLLDNAPAHPRVLLNRHPNVTVVFLPPNTTSLVQPLDQEIIANVKASYASKVFAMLEKEACTKIKEDITEVLGEETTPSPPRSPPVAPPPHAPSRNSENESDPDDPAPQAVAAGSSSSSCTLLQAGDMAVVNFWRRLDIKTAIDLFVESWRELSEATIHHAWRNLLEGLPEHKLHLPVFQRQLYETAVQQAVQAARQVVGLEEVDEQDIEEIIMPEEEENFAQILEEIEEEEEDEQQQQLREEQGEGQAGEPKTAELRKCLELIEIVAHQIFNMDPNSARAYEILTDVKNSVQRYDDMLGNRMNKMLQSKITAYLRGRQEEQQPQQQQLMEEEIDAGSETDVLSDSDIDDVLSTFSGFEDEPGENEAYPEPPTASLPQPLTSAAPPP